MQQNLPTPPSPLQIGQNLNVRHYWHLILERRWLVLASFFTIIVLTAVYLVRATPIYSASVRVQIDRESANPLNPREAVSLDTREQDYLQTQYKNIVSRSLIESVVNALKLDKDPRYAKAMDVVDAVSRDISVVPIRLSRLVDVKVEHPRPEVAMNIANTLAKNFIEQNLDQKVNSSFQAMTWLMTQVADAKNKVEKSEADLQAYRQEFNEVSLEDGENIVRQSLMQAQTELSKVRAESAQAQQAVTEMERLINDGQAIDTIPLVAQSSVVQEIRKQIDIETSNLAALLKRYRDKYPTVIAARSKLDALHNSLVAECDKQMQSIRNNASLLKKSEEKLNQLVEAETQQQQKLNQLKIKYDILKRDAENNKTIHSSVLVRMKETELMSRLNSNNMRVVDPATKPLLPVKPRKVITVLMGLVAAIAVSLSLALFVSYLDDSIKSQDDIENHLRLPFLGYVPNIKTNSVVERDLQAHLHPQSNAAEGFRTIRATLSLAHKADRIRVVSVTSTIPSEGKSLVASNLAIVLAQTGMRTLLVDADLRRPSVHKAYQLHSPIGLSAYLAREIDDLSEITHTTEVPNLDVICCGALPSNPSELTGSNRMAEFIDRVKDKYDRIVLDCPPVSAVSDPLVISAMSDGVVYVNKFNKIRREHARKSVARIQNAGIQILGVVINDIDFEGKDSYYYSYYYYSNRYYASHYKTQPTPTPSAKPIGAPIASNGAKEKTENRRGVSV
ncbi:MAG TPA: polysaccharide biosynthesis tyrosine autokinase [Verrucomicrobiae bacterium]